MEVIIKSNYAEASRCAAEIVADQIRKKPESILGLATGSTPEGMYRELVQMCKSGAVSFARVTSFNLDEYYGLDGSDPQSYRYFMNEHLFNAVDIDPAKTFVPNGKTQEPAAYCPAYDRMIEEAGGVDLQVLGIGPNGHIGFNEPADHFTAGTHLVDLTEATIRANARFFASEGEVPRQAISMGIKTIMLAKKILLLVNSSAKKEITEKALYGPITPWVPASVIQLHPNVTVICSYE